MKSFFFVLMVLFSAFFPVLSANADISDGLIAYYPFNGNANDESGNGNDGVVVGATLTTDRFGHANSAYSFNGVDNYIAVSDSPSQQISTNQITISAWLLLNENVGPTQWRIVNKQESNEISWGLQIFGDDYDTATGNNVTFHDSNGSSWVNCVANKINLSTKSWYHVSTTDYKGTIRLYVNGDLKQICHNGVGVPSYIDSPIVIAKTESENRYYFNGFFDDIRIYNRALSESEIRTLYNHSPEYIYYLPYFKKDAEMGTGIGLRNLSDSQDATISIGILDAKGMTLSTEDETIPVRGQKAWMVGNNLTAEGWIKVESDQPLGGLCFLSYGLDYMADIPMTDTLSKELVVPHVGQSEDWDTTIYICNPNNASTEVSLTFINEDGSPKFTQYYDIPANGSGKYNLLDLVDDEDYVNGSVEISADKEITAFALYYNQKTGGGCFSGINAVIKE